MLGNLSRIADGGYPGPSGNEKEEGCLKGWMTHRGVVLIDAEPAT